MKSKIIRYLIVVFSILAILFSLFKILNVNKKLDTYLAIGDYLSVSGKLKGEEIVSFSDLLGDYFVSNHLVENVNTDYASSRVDSSLLLEMINKDAYNGSDFGLVSLIESSKYITISVGMNDIIDYIRFDSNNQKIIYDKEFIKRKLEIMKQNYYEIIDEIESLNDKASVYLVGYYNPFSWVDEGNKGQVNEVFKLLNDSIKEVSELMGVIYVDISDVGVNKYIVNETEIYLNQNGHDCVFSIFKEILEN